MKGTDPNWHQSTSTEEHFWRNYPEGRGDCAESNCSPEAAPVAIQEQAARYSTWHDQTHGRLPDCDEMLRQSAGQASIKQTAVELSTSQIELRAHGQGQWTEASCYTQHLLHEHAQHHALVVSTEQQNSLASSPQQWHRTKLVHAGSNTKIALQGLHMAHSQQQAHTYTSLMTPGELITVTKLNKAARHTTIARLHIVFGTLGRLCACHQTLGKHPVEP